jgi:predicted nuclease of predicted toxin-antitoxin system
MRFLTDNALSPLVAELLTRAGHDATHVRDHGLQAAPDETVFALAAVQGRILVSADTDFGALLALRDAAKPSFVLFRGGPRRPEAQVALLLRSLATLTDALDAGAVVVFEAARIRVRTLPFGRRL